MWDRIAIGLMVWAFFAWVGLMTRFFATRPRAFLRCFVPAEELRGVARSILPRSQFRTGHAVDFHAATGHRRSARAGGNLFSPFALTHGRIVN